MIKFVEFHPFLFVLSFVLFMFGCSVAFTDEFSEWRHRIKAWWPASDGLSKEVREALKKRTARYDSYVTEFLGYGFTLQEAQSRAGTRIAKEAAEAIKAVDAV